MFQQRGLVQLLTEDPGHIWTATVRAHSIYMHCQHTFHYTIDISPNFSLYPANSVSRPPAPNFELTRHGEFPLFYHRLHRLEDLGACPSDIIHLSEFSHHSHPHSATHSKILKRPRLFNVRQRLLKVLELLVDPDRGLLRLGNLQPNPNLIAWPLQSRLPPYRLALECLNRLDVIVHVILDGLEFAQDTLCFVHDRLVLEHRPVVFDVHRRRLNCILAMDPLGLRVTLSERLQRCHRLCCQTSVECAYTIDHLCAHPCRVQETSRCESSPTQPCEQTYRPNESGTYDRSSK